MVPILIAEGPYFYAHVPIKYPGIKQVLLGLQHSSLVTNGAHSARTTNGCVHCECVALPTPRFDVEIGAMQRSIPQM